MKFVKRWTTDDRNKQILHKGMLDRVRMERSKVMCALGANLGN